MKNDVNFIKKKKLLMGINSGELNKNLLFYINEARSSPKDFSRHLMINDDVDEKISNLSLFFKYSSNEVFPLNVDQNLEKCSHELLYHIISIDNEKSSFKFNQKEKEKNCLKERLKRLNLIPTYHIDLLIIGIDSPIEVLSNILLNKTYRKKILSPEMKYIGIASGYLPSERICYVIDIVHSFKIYDRFLYNRIKYSHNKSPIKYNYIRYRNEDSDEYNKDNYEEEDYFNDNNNLYNFNKYTNNNRDVIYDNYNPKYSPPKAVHSNRKNFNLVQISPSKSNIYENDNYNKYKYYTIENKNKEIGDLRISNQKCLSPFNEDKRFYKTFYSPPKQFKIPVSISFEKKYAKNEEGKIFPIYSKQTKYDDGSILIQPYMDEYDSYL